MHPYLICTFVHPSCTGQTVLVGQWKLIWSAGHTAWSMLSLETCSRANFVCCSLDQPSAFLFIWGLCRVHRSLFWAPSLDHAMLVFFLVFCFFFVIKLVSCWCFVASADTASKLVLFLYMQGHLLLYAEPVLAEICWSCEVMLPSIASWKSCECDCVNHPLNWLNVYSPPLCIHIAFTLVVLCNGWSAKVNIVVIICKQATQFSRLSWILSCVLQKMRCSTAESYGTSAIVTLGVLWGEVTDFSGECIANTLTR